jgi:hypothetical protein
MTNDILEYARQLATQPTVNFMSNYQRYDLEVPEDIHWELVKLAADLKMHHEDYAQNILIDHVERKLDQQVTS